jgi:molybdopterin-guanine dinucleotide biosynthesis protein A
MGGAKPQRLLGGAPLLDRVIAKARAWSDSTAVAIRGPEQYVPRGTAVIEDVQDVEGPLGGLIAALNFAVGRGADAVLVVPADMPLLPSDLRERLEAALSRSAAALASSGGHLHPVCGIWRTQCAVRVPDYLASGKRSLRGFAAAVGAAAIEWDVEPTDPFFNINTPGDLLAAEQMLSI